MSTSSTTGVWAQVFEALGFIGLLVGIEQLLVKSWIAGAVLVVLGPISFFLAGGAARIREALARLPRLKIVRPGGRGDEPAHLIEEGRERQRRYEIRTHVRDIVQKYLIQSHDAMERALRTSFAYLPTGDRLSGELARAYEYLLEDSRHDQADLNVLANRSLQEAPEETKVPVETLVERLVSVVSDHFRLWRALDGLTIVPSVMLGRPQELAAARVVLEQLKAELRSTAHADGFAAVRHLSQHLQPSEISQSAPRVVPIRYGRLSPQRAEEGLFIANLGEAARSVIAQQIRLGRQIVSFDGPEVAQLRREDGERFLDVTIERASHDISVDLAESLRDWQQEIGDPKRETVGVITYTDFDGRRYESYYRLGIDVQNRDAGIVVEFLEQRRM